MTQKYHPYPPIDNPNRRWPDQRITAAPIWCSVDLRDGNQALVNPMNLEQKLRFFHGLLEMGFKEIEVGFPSASETEFNFLRKLIQEDRIPEGVTVQVLTQAREHLIQRSFEALEGIKGKAILHLYNSTSIAQRKIVFQKSKAEIIQIALQGVDWVKQYMQPLKNHIRFQYSPESFTGTELDYAIEICEAVLDRWGDSKEKVIINLPATVELSTPNIYADMVEVFLNRFSRRQDIILSVHTHNDRGTGIAATELALLAGADRVEGTLFGNGERTGNVDIVTLALNMKTQGVDPQLKLDHLPEIVEISDQCTTIPVHCRHPYAGELVFTAFSGSHQDAINKGMAIQAENAAWEVPYLAIDPKDIGRSYEAIIRINTQSGKGGAAYVMATEFGCHLPKKMQAVFGKFVQNRAEKEGRELQSEELWDVFETHFIKGTGRITLHSVEVLSRSGNTQVDLQVTIDGHMYDLKGSGNGPIDACKAALTQKIPEFQIYDYSEHALDQKGSQSTAIAYIQVGYSPDKTVFGVGIDPNISEASIQAMIAAISALGLP